SYAEAADAAIAHFGDVCLSGERYFIQPAAMNHESALGAQFQQSRSHQIDGLVGKNSQDLPVSACGIRERTEQIEHRAPADLFARWHRMPGGCVSDGREEETDADFANGPACVAHGHVNANAEGFHDVGGAAARAARTIAMLGDSGACGCGHER